LLSRSRIRNRVGVARFRQSPGDLTRLLRDPRAARVPRAASEIHPPTANLDHKQHVQALQQDGLDSEEVDGEHVLRLRAQELAPGEPGALADGSKAGLPKRLAYGAGRDGRAQAGEFACDPLLARAPVLGARRSTSSRISRPTGCRPARPGYAHRLATKWRCHRRSVLGVTRNDRQLARGSSRLAAARKTRSVCCSPGRATCQRSPASSWRSTTISSSLTGRGETAAPRAAERAEA
jgi:hypothetical protein